MPQSELILTPEQFAVLRDLVAGYSGVYLDESRQRVLAAGLAQRLAATEMPFATYAGRLGQPAGRAELHRLAELVLNHETVFFRNQPHIRALREVVLPQLQRRKPAGAPLRIWSAGCATGEEPYSLAIVALETLGSPLQRPVEIYATDLSESALAKARAGSYHGRTLTHVSPEQRVRFFERRSGSYTIRDEVRALVNFACLNLLDPFPAWAHGIDIIFCQNVTIYFQLATCRELMRRFYEVMGEGSLLFLGFSETLWNVFDRFRSREIAGSFVYYKESHYVKPGPAPMPHSAAPRVTVPLVARSAALSSEGRHIAQGPQPGPPQGRPEPIAAPLPPGSGAAEIRRARDLLTAGRAEDALVTLYQAPFDRTYAPEALVLAARAHANRGDLDLAVAEARRALELDALTTEAYLLLGMLFAQQSKGPSPACLYLQGAAEQFERARYLEPDSALISFHLAEVYRQLNRSALALREYRNALRKLEPLPPDALLDGAAVGWIRETCQRYIDILTNRR